MKLREWRRSQGLSVPKAARRFGVDVRTWQRWERGQEPKKQQRVAIYIESGGQVAPNDYVDLPALDREAA